MSTEIPMGLDTPPIIRPQISQIPQTMQKTRTTQIRHKTHSMQETQIPNTSHTSQIVDTPG
jgi:hypothetical protein